MVSELGLRVTGSGRHSRVGNAQGARAGQRRFTGVIGDGTPRPPKTLPETSVKGARLPMLSHGALGTVPCVRDSSANFLRAPGPSRDDARLGGAVGPGTAPAPALLRPARRLVTGAAPLTGIIAFLDAVQFEIARLGLSGIEKRWPLLTTFR